MMSDGSHLEVSIKQWFTGVTWQWLTTGGRIRAGLSFWLITQVLLVIHGSPSLAVWDILWATHFYRYKKVVVENLKAFCETRCNQSVVKRHRVVSRMKSTSDRRTVTRIIPKYYHKNTLPSQSRVWKKLLAFVSVLTGDSGSVALELSGIWSGWEASES